MRSITIVAAIITAFATIVAAYISKSDDNKVASKPEIQNSTNITNIIAVGPEKVYAPPEKKDTGIKGKEEASSLGESPQKALKKERSLVVGQEWWEQKIGFYVKLDSIKYTNYYADMSNESAYCAHLLIQTPESRPFPLDVCDKHVFVFESDNISYKVKILNNPSKYADVRVGVTSN